MARKEAYLTAPRQYDDVIYTPYSYESSSSLSPKKSLKSLIKGRPPKRTVREGDLLGIPELREEEERAIAEDAGLGYDDSNSAPSSPTAAVFDRQVKPQFKPAQEEEIPTSPEVFIFEYGTVVLWGMTESQEKRFLNSLWVITVQLARMQPKVDF